MFKFIGEVIGTCAGVVAGIAIAPVAIALNVSETAVKAAIEAGCTTVDEIKEFLGL